MTKTAKPEKRKAKKESKNDFSRFYALAAGVLSVVVLLLIVFGIYFYFFASSDQGIPVPENFTVYEDAEEFQIAYPNGYDLDGFGSFVVITPLDSSYTSLQLSISSLEDLENDSSEEAFAALMDQDCEAYFDISVETNEDSEIGVSLLSAKNIELNGYDACDFEFSTNNIEDTPYETKSYLVLDKEGWNSAVFITVSKVTDLDEEFSQSTIGEVDDAFDLLVKSARTFQFKSL